MKIEGGPFEHDEHDESDKKEEGTPYSRLADAIMNTPSMPRQRDRRIDCVPDLLIDKQQKTRYRLELTEHQLLYLHALVSVDEGDNAENLSSKHFEELVSMLCYHKSGIDGPPSGGM